MKNNFNNEKILSCLLIGLWFLWGIVNCFIFGFYIYKGLIWYEKLIHDFVPFDLNFGLSFVCAFLFFTFFIALTFKVKDCLYRL